MWTSSTIRRVLTYAIAAIAIVTLSLLLWAGGLRDFLIALHGR